MRWNFPPTTLLYHRNGPGICRNYYHFKSRDIQAFIEFALEEAGMQDGPEFRQVLINDFSFYLEAYRKKSLTVTAQGRPGPGHQKELQSE